MEKAEDNTVKVKANKLLARCAVKNLQQGCGQVNILKRIIDRGEKKAQISLALNYDALDVANKTETVWTSATGNPKYDNISHH